MQYEPGVKLISIATGIKGEVVENRKLPGDICVQWETGQMISYDPEWLVANCKLVEPIDGDRSVVALHVRL